MLTLPSPTAFPNLIQRAQHDCPNARIKRTLTPIPSLSPASRNLPINRILQVTERKELSKQAHLRLPRGPKSDQFIQDMFKSHAALSYQGQRNTGANDPLRSKRYPRQRTDVTRIGF